MNERSDFNNDALGSETPDIHSSSADYTSRFSGSVGAWFLAKQRAALLGVFSSQYQDALDVGGGHAQNLFLLKEEVVANLTILGSTQDCFSQVYRAELQPAPDCVIGPLTALPFPERSFDLVLSFRMLTHLNAWQQHIDELCRVSRHTVCIEFPVAKGFNQLSSLFFGVKKSVEKNTRPYRLFDETHIIAAFAANQFVLSGRSAQYFWPMAVHRLIHCLPVAKTMEAVPSLLRLTAWLGSPVVACFERKKEG
jgi:SAM-dependent methyltransferase